MRRFLSSPISRSLRPVRLLSASSSSLSFSSSSSFSNVWDELQWRGLIQDASRDASFHLSTTTATTTKAKAKATEATETTDTTTSKTKPSTRMAVDTFEKAEKDEEEEDERKQSGVYAGFDPTAASLHVGHLQVLSALSVCVRHRWNTIALVGGGTAMIGDPSGRVSERVMLTGADVRANARSVQRQIEHVVLRYTQDAHRDVFQLVDNAVWIESMNVLAFLRDVGKHVRVNPMLRMDSIRSRLETTDGISFTEFAYALLQANDFVHLATHFDVSVQIGGSDQWGNIMLGIDLNRRMYSRQTFGVTLPLLTTEDGVKIGKSVLSTGEQSSVWLDSTKTSPFDLYQYFVRLSEKDSEKLLRSITTISVEEFNSLMDCSLRKDPSERFLQHELAKRITTLLHGEEAAESASVSSSLLFGSLSRPSNQNMSVENREKILQTARLTGVPVLDLSFEQFTSVTVAALCESSGLVSSRAEAKRLAKQSGVFIDTVPISDATRSLAQYIESQVCPGDLYTLRVGKKRHCLVHILP